ncbi:SERTA domain-containing protein 2-like [Anguilla anguilla]|uniref:SERTA domain-containing protein 2-like n=1 Tax=Anguilla anguilla TaxID=7936 RepID=UPI0015B0FA7B|nr:SERTA domain-containing protein 2-like [Anguilla anguilla]
MGQMGFFSYQTSMRRRNNAIQTASMCRLDGDTTGKEVDQPDALSSSRYLVGRGVKRKRSESEEEEAGPEAGRAGPEPWGAESHAQERQLILDLCLSKLQSCYSQAEPSLRRSVLLANTLRHIQDQMRREGVDPPATPASSPPRAPPTPRHAPQLPPAEPEGPAYSSSFSSSSSSSSSSLSSSSSVDSLFGSFEISSTTSYLTDLALDDIFEDIDTSMYDPTDFSALTSPDEGLKPVPACAPTGALQLCLTDLSELDHIMEVLVQS